jgi:polyhydroxyalkanoate synthase
LLPNAHEVRFEIVPGGHLGMLTGRAARRTTWVVMDEWIAQYSTPDDHEEPAAPRTSRKRTTRKTATRKTGKATKSAKSTARTTKKAASPSSSTSSPRKLAPSAEVAPDRGAIGSNPVRRFTSGASRGLAPER